MDQVDTTQKRIFTETTFRELVVSGVTGRWYALSDTKWSHAQRSTSRRVIHGRVVPTAQAVLVDTIQSDLEQMQCPHCEKETWFKNGGVGAGHNLHDSIKLNMECNNCEQITRIVVLEFAPAPDGVVHIMKLGETPVPGGPLPRALLKFAGDAESIDLLRRAQWVEGLGLGVGAFAYYRQFLERKTAALFDLTIGVLGGHGMDTAAIEEAKKQYRYKGRFDEFPLPDQLYLPKSHANPFILLYAELSNGIHEGGTDDECMQSAADVRKILTFLVATLDRLNRDNTAIVDAATRLMNRQKSRADAKP